MRKKLTGRCYIVVALLFLVAATPLFGQNVGTVRGEVRTADGEPVPGSAGGGHGAASARRAHGDDRGEW